MSKRKSKEQKIISDLHKKLQSQQATSSRHLPTQSSVYSYKATSQHVTKPTVITLNNMTHVKHDLLKTSIIIASIISAQMLLFYLLKMHIIMIPMVRY